MLAIGSGGCSLSSQFDNYFGGEKADSIALKTAAASGQGVDTLPPTDDLVYARAAAAEVLRNSGNGVSVSWENPHSGAHGTVTPVASAYTQDGRTCHDFLASYVAGGAESWMQGEACKQEQGAWEVRSFKPWKHL